MTPPSIDRTVPRSPAASEAVIADLMMPHQANGLRHPSVFGGVIMSMVDRCAALSAMRHAGGQATTLSIDRILFKEPIHVGELVEVRSRVVHVGRTSMSVLANVYAENIATGERRHTNECWLTFVAPRPDREARAPCHRSAWTATRTARCTPRRRGGARLARRARQLSLPRGTRDAVRFLRMKLFTVDHANRTLPLVRRIVEDVVREHQRWQETIAELDLRRRRGALRHPATRASTRSSASAQDIAREIDAFQTELESLGIQLKDRRIGLVDFPSELDGRRVLLCWRLGEPYVQYWHDEDAGYRRSPAALSPTLVG